MVCLESGGSAVDPIQIQTGFSGHHRTAGGQAPFDGGDLDIRPQRAWQGKCLGMPDIRPMRRSSQIQMSRLQRGSAVVPEGGPVQQIDGRGIGQSLNALQGRTLGQVETVTQSGMIAGDVEVHDTGMNADQAQDGNGCQYQDADDQDGAGLRARAG